ncbi:hypothetical protein ACD578_29330 (plasmid) [Microvirga sp. RSM25]|uniref:hypothetical protein n=1 Tax=Microvirga sp. RSM25 TaxID=3273802 RepID=UPI00384DEBC4
MQFASFEEGHVAMLGLGRGRKVIVSTGRGKDGSIGFLAVAPDAFARARDTINSKKSTWSKTLALDLKLNALESLVEEVTLQTTAEIVRFFYSNCFRSDTVEQSGGFGLPSPSAKPGRNRNPRQEQPARLT